jgi:uncharacterized membrane protein YebE (DUF533 family)
MEAKLGRDVFLALAAVGWADGKLDSDEADAICRAALEEGLDIDEVSEIEKATKTPVDVGSIDISKLSKADRLFVYAVGSWIARVDGTLADAEKEALEKLGIALRIPSRPRANADAVVDRIGKLSESSKPAFFNLPALRKTLKDKLAQAAAERAQAREEEEEE